MIWFVSWLIAVELIALAALPLAVRIFRWLPDRGALFAKPLGILVVGYACWLPGVFGALRFERATIAAALVVLAAGGWLRWGRETIKQVTGIRTALIVLELAFIAAIAGAAFIRAGMPDISGTEKPMDFAIFNAFYRTDALPAEDPWMSGQSISYYYFGYYLLAMVAKLSAVPASVGYNLSLALVFALLIAGSYSLALNLISAVRPRWSPLRAVFGALLAPVVVGVMGNMEIGLEVLAARGYANDAFWKLVAIKGLQPATQVQGWFPDSFWWWWRASRVIPTTKPDGINEFPFFSFLLGDLHAHFTVLPWALLAVAVSLAALLARVSAGPSPRRDWTFRLTVAAALGFLLVGNSWDFPSYTGLFWLASLVPLAAGDWARSRFVAALKELALISFLSVLLYAPFFLGFSSQTKGLGLSADRTPLASLLIIFAPVLLVLAVFLAWRVWPDGWEGGKTGRDVTAARLLPGAGIVLVLASLVLGSASLLGSMILLAVAAFLRLNRRVEAPDMQAAGALFLLVLTALGLLLIFVPEFVFIYDLFGTRMNTVFKFDYQAWVLLGLAASVAVVWMAAALRPLLLRAALLVPFALLVAIGLLYPVASVPARMREFSAQPTLDGAAFLERVRPGDYAAIQWLSRTARGRPVVLEATGGAYTDYARVSTFSGLPTVLGWGGHEAQWGRDGADLRQRQQDIDAIYSTADSGAALALLQKYQVEYVVVGSLEIEKYGPTVAERFNGLLEPVYHQGQVTVYRTTQRTGYAAPGGRAPLALLTTSRWRSGSLTADSHFGAGY